MCVRSFQWGADPVWGVYVDVPVVAWPASGDLSRRCGGCHGLLPSAPGERSVHRTGPAPTQHHPHPHPSPPPNQCCRLVRSDGVSARSENRRATAIAIRDTGSTGDGDRFDGARLPFDDGGHTKFTNYIQSVLCIIHISGVRNVKFKCSRFEKLELLAFM